MIAILLTSLKVLGILLLILLITAAVLLLLVLFVPVRYRIVLRRREADGILAAVEIKATWLLHLINAAFSYPEAAFLRVRIFCFTVFRSDRKKKESDPAPKQKRSQKKQDPAREEESSQNEDTGQAPSQKAENNQKNQTEVPAGAAKEEPHSQKEPEPGEEPEQKRESGQKTNIFTKIKEFFLKLLSLFQNIRYTITKICDKIKHIVNNIQYYLKILKSDTFSRAWTLCSGQAFSLLKSILPGKLRGSLVIGTGDPAGTGQVLAVYGMLYPLLGNHITVAPDFERQIVEGELFLRGKITVFKGLKTAWKIYFSRDLRRLIQLFKREAA